MQSHGNCSQGIVNIIRTYQVGLDRVPLTSLTAPAELHERVTLQNLTFNKQSVRSRLTIFYNGKTLTHLLEMLIVSVYECRSVMLTQPVIKLALGTLYALKRSESQKMSLAHIGYQPKVRLAYLHQFLYVTRMAGTHLNDGILMLSLKSQNGKRHSY